MANGGGMIPFPSWKRSMSQQPSHSMSADVSLIEAELPIAASATDGNPRPAFIRSANIDLAPKADCDSFWCRLRFSHVAPPVQVVRDGKESKVPFRPVHSNMVH